MTKVHSSRIHGHDILGQAPPQVAVGTVVLALVATIAALPAAAVEPFYQAMLDKGADASHRGDFDGAARALRVACFGMLEEPPELAGCLMRLAVAQASAGQTEQFRTTFQRVVIVEERFGGVTAAAPPEALRQPFESAARRLVTPATLAEGPFAYLAAGEAEPGRRPVARETQRAPAARAARDGAVPAAAESAGGTAVAAQAAGQAAVPVPPPAASAPQVVRGGPGAAAPATAATAPVTSARDPAVVESIRKRFSGPDLAAAVNDARDLASGEPSWRNAQFLAGEGCYRTAHFADAVMFFTRGGPPGNLQPELCFYLAVSLFETGRREEAAAELRRCLGGLKRTPYVDGYVEKILGEKQVEARR